MLPREVLAGLRHHGPRLAPFALVALAYAWVRVAHLHALEEPLQTFDSAIYLGMARMSPGDTRFWIGERPWTVPLVFKMLPDDPRAIAWFQLAVSTVCWTLAAAVFARSLRAPLLRLAAFAAILLLSLSAAVAVWDGVILSESLSLSLMALVIAAWLWLAERWRWRALALVAAVALLWTFARDSNGWVLLAAAALSALAAAVARPARRYALVAALLGLCFVAGDATVSLAARWAVPFVNVLGRRILPSPERSAFFAHRGMPVTPSLTARAGKLAWSDDWAVFRDPGLRSFWTWAHASARATYLEFLAAHPASTLVEPARELDRLVSPDLSRWRPRGHSAALGGLADALYFRRGTVAWVVAAGALGAAALAWSVRRRDWRAVVPLGLIAVAVPHALVVWHGDTSSLERHAVAVGIQLRLAVWMLLLVLADVAVTGTALRRAAPAFRTGPGPPGGSPGCPP
jgi:hypothetical protein